MRAADLSERKITAETPGPVGANETVESGSDAKLQNARVLWQERNLNIQLNDELGRCETLRAKPRSTEKNLIPNKYKCYE
jgi:hypothetical protein